MFNLLMRIQQYKLVMNSDDVFEWICTMRIIFLCQVGTVNELPGVRYGKYDWCVRQGIDTSNQC